MSKSFMKLSKSLRNVTIFPHPLIRRLCHSSVQIKENQNDIKTEIGNAKELFSLINQDKNPSNLIRLIEINKNQIDGSHIVAALTSMLKFYQENDFPSPEIQKSEHFSQMCSILRKNLRKLDLSGLIQSLKLLNLVDVPSSSFIVQSILQLIRCSINDLYLEQIYYLSFLLTRMEPTNLSKAILQALPEVFVAQLQFQIDEDNIKELSNALRYASNHNLDENIIRFILDALNSHEKNIDINIAISVLLSFCRIVNLPNNYLHILDNVQNVILDNINLLEGRIAKPMLLKTVKKTMDGNNEFYNPHFIDKLIERIIVNKYKFSDVAFILNKLNAIGHINLSLLDYMSSEIYENPSLLSTSHPLSLSTFVAGLAFANYKPSVWNELQEIILKYFSRISDDVTLIYFALHLASLGCFDETLLKHIFTKDQIPTLMSQSFHQTYQKLYQSVKTLYPVYCGPWPSESLIQSFKTAHRDCISKEYPLQNILENILGGPAFLQTNVRTNLGHIIDHLIILQDGRPISIETNTPLSSIRCVEDFNIPSNTEKIAVLFMPFEAYGRNIQRLKAPHLLNMKSLKSMSYKVVHIPKHLCHNIPDYELLPYIKQEIGVRNISCNER